jgi:sialate O-acetylesterase
MHTRRLLLVVAVGALVAIGLPGISRSEEPVRVSCLGDSITYGWELPKGQRGQLNYPGQLQRLLGDGYRVADFGYPGATVQRQTARPIWAHLQSPGRGLPASRPRIVVLLLGTNDTHARYWQGMSPFLQDYRALVEFLQQLPSRPRVLLGTLPSIAPRGRYGSPERERLARDINRQLRRLAAELNLPLVDFSTALEQTERRLLFQDALHPSPLGYGRMAEQAATALRQVRLESPVLP